MYGNPQLLRTFVLGGSRTLSHEAFSVGTLPITYFRFTELTVVGSTARSTTARSERTVFRGPRRALAELFVGLGVSFEIEIHALFSLLPQTFIPAIFAHLPALHYLCRRKHCVSRLQRLHLCSSDYMP